MIWVRDLTGRFPERPHYEPREIDFECENLITQFLLDRHGRVTFPISTDDLTLLIERDTDDLDIYADLSKVGDDIDGLTDFFFDKLPEVKVSQHLSRQTSQNRLRTTLTHEYGHVHFHSFLWHNLQSSFFPKKNPEGPRCRRQNIIGAQAKDWMEWQAGYASGALLMPKANLRMAINDYFSNKNDSLFGISADQIDEVILTVSAIFQVSNEAARVRLSQQGYILNASQYQQTLKLS